MTERVRAPRDVHRAPPRVERGDADAAARRVLDDYLRQQQAATRRAGAGRRLARVFAIAGLALVGAALGAFVGSLRGQAVPVGGAMAAAGALLGAFTTRR